MTALASQILPKNPTRPIAWSEFQRKYLSREDGYKYEWLNGFIEKSKKTMDYTQFFIQDNLLTFFNFLKYQGKVTGQLIAEGDMFFLKNHRKPDMAYISREQIDKAADGENPTPKFVVEVVSTSDAINRVYRKMQNYRDADVRVVWMVFPQLSEVHLHFGENLDEVRILRGNQICSAAPILPDFQLTVNEIFKRNSKAS